MQKNDKGSVEMTLWSFRIHLFWKLYHKHLSLGYCNENMHNTFHLVVVSLVTRLSLNGNNNYYFQMRVKMPTQLTRGVLEMNQLQRSTIVALHIHESIEKLNESVGRR